MILSKKFKQTAIFGLLLTLSATSLLADQVTTLDGSVIKGSITEIEDGKISIETSYAGVIVVNQSEVANFTAASEINVATDSGNTILGTVDANDSGLVIASESGDFSTSVGGVVSAWAKGEKSPEEKAHDAELEALQRKWTYDAYVDISGKSGNSDRFSTAVGFKAQRKNSEDQLTFYTSIDIAEENDNKSADEIKGGVDFSSFISDTFSWYARMEMEQDEIEEIDLRATTAIGFGKHIIKKKSQSLELRAGLAYRYEDFQDDPTVESPGLDLILLHKKDFSFGAMTNLITINPVFEDLSNYRLFHESALSMPIGAAGYWTMKLGISNDYSSEPPEGLSSMDTTYFTRLNLSWK